MCIIVSTNPMKRISFEDVKQCPELCHLTDVQAIEVAETIKLFPVKASLTTTFESVTFPVLVTTKLYEIVSPGLVTPIGAKLSTYVPSLVIAIEGVFVKGVSVHVGQVGLSGQEAQGVGSVEVAVTGFPVGGFPEATAKL